MPCDLARAAWRRRTPGSRRSRRTGSCPPCPMSWSASSMPAVDDSFGVKIPAASSPKRLSRFSDARFAVSRVAPAYWSDDRISMPGTRRLAASSRKPSSRAVVRGRALLVAQQEHLALAAEEPAHLLGGQLAALEVVGGDEAHDRRDARSESMMTVGIPSLLRLLDRPHQGLVVERREHDAARHPWLAKPSTTWTCCSRSSSRIGPFQMISTSTAARRSGRAPP